MKTAFLIIPGGSLSPNFRDIEQRLLTKFESVRVIRLREVGESKASFLKKNILPLLVSAEVYSAPGTRMCKDCYDLLELVQVVFDVDVTSTNTLDLVAKEDLNFLSWLQQKFNTKFGWFFTNGQKTINND
jgi:hypothetical protein